MIAADDANLTQFWGLEKDYIRRRDLNRVNWTKSAKAGAVGIYPVGGTPLLPTVDFLFAETPPASGTKGPSNPSTITGVSSVKVTRCGKNLLVYPFSDGAKTDGSITFTPIGGGGISISGVDTRNRYYRFVRNLYLSSGTKITMSANIISGTGVQSQLSLQIVKGSTIYWQNLSSTPSAVTISDSGLHTYRLYVGANTEFSNYVIEPQFELGSTATSFEPYSGNDYVVDLGGTYYGGSIDLATGVMTVTHGVKVLNGTESWSLTSSSTETVSNFQTTIASLSGCTGVACSHYVLYSSGVTENYFTIYSDGRLRIGGLSATTYPDKNVFESWLATQYANGTPVTVAYAMATPQTVQLTPTEILSLTQPDKYTPRLNTLYTDAQAVQVGYVKSPIREEFELQQAVTALGGNV